MVKRVVRGMTPIDIPPPNSLSLKTWSLYRKVSKSGEKYRVMYLKPLPTPHRRLPITRGTILAWIFRKGREFMCHHPSFFFIRPADYLLIAGKKSRKNPPYPIGKDTIIISIGSPDYETFLKTPKKKERERIAVFIDSDDLHTTDILNMGGKLPVLWEREYYRNLLNLFNKLSNELNIEIVIAGHPKTGSGRYFPGYEYTEGKTSELVRDAEFVLCHSSTAIGFAVLYRKPIIFLTDENLKNFPTGPIIEAMAHELGKEVVYTDKELGKLNMEVNESIYRLYEENYIHE